jgi:AcrR family transcriptional regulator
MSSVTTAPPRPDVLGGSRRAASLPPEERRAAIVAAVVPLLAVHGERVTSKQIACAAGVAEGTVFRVFRDKDELIEAAVDALVDPAPLERDLAVIDSTLPLPERLVAATEILQQRVTDIWQVLSALGPKLHARARGPLADSDALAALFAADADLLRVPPAEAARTLRAVTMSLTHPMMIGHPATAAQIVDVVLHGIAAPTERRP